MQGTVSLSRVAGRPRKVRNHLLLLPFAAPYTLWHAVVWCRCARYRYLRFRRIGPEKGYMVSGRYSHLRPRSRLTRGNMVGERYIRILQYLSEIGHDGVQVGGRYCPIFYHDAEWPRNVQTCSCCRPLAPHTLYHDVSWSWCASYVQHEPIAKSPVSNGAPAVESWLIWWFRRNLPEALHLFSLNPPQFLSAGSPSLTLITHPLFSQSTHHSLGDRSGAARQQRTETSALRKRKVCVPCLRSCQLRGVACTLLSRPLGHPAGRVARI